MDRSCSAQATKVKPTRDTDLDTNREKEKRLTKGNLGKNGTIGA